jgi:hypothetical protein
MREFPEKPIRNMLHALGISHSKGGDYYQPNRRYSPYLTSYRNYYQIEDCDVWNSLVEKGYAKKTVNGLNLTYYFVTDAGKAYLREFGYKWHEGD